MLTAGFIHNYCYLSKSSPASFLFVPIRNDATFGRGGLAVLPILRCVTEFGCQAFVSFSASRFRGLARRELSAGSPGCLVLYFDTMMLVALMTASTSSPLLIFIS